ncbi:murein transglycosylase [Vibrio genomosp. F10 str. 9ZC157]|uniref:Lytic murein transglycosylase n=1 Tax=Vibrio genomosp. F10 str. ZF-129 TaxID=1187848 RepID=A0A1E5BJQ3_9VIBR|nr:lytic murein transglycosylase [Vibrio genomosp. F10 str. ZF-129]OEE93355.1 lytic murein transglycosylase [Vibrio genomosp. F10 str. 9ZC157]
MKLMPFTLPQRLLTSMIAVSSLMSGTSYAETSSSITTQRKLYQQAQQLLDDKNIKQYRQMREQIASYPLTPYVDYRAFLAELEQKTPEDVSHFIDTYQSFPFSYRIRAPYLDELASKKDWSTLLAFQTKRPNGETYQCHYYYAHFKVGDKAKAFKGANDLWLSGEGVSDACDPLFKAWSEAGLKTDPLILERMLLAFKAGNSSLMNYLMKQLDSSSAATQAKEMQSLYREPKSVGDFASKHKPNDFHQKLSMYALKKLARKDIEQAQSAFEEVVNAQQLPKESQQELADFLAFRLINTDSSELANWRDEAIKTSQNRSLMERRIRLSIQHADWEGLQKWTALLPNSYQQLPRWQYWLGRSEIALGDTSSGHQRLEKIVGLRNFYSVAAAKEIKQSIQYPVTTITLDHALIKHHQVALTRIQELIDTDKITAAKSEWRWLLKNSPTKEKEMLAAYASTQRWHHLSVAASISAKMWDNTSLRFPIAHMWWFNFYGEKHNIDPITLMSLARQESALDSEAQSPVGARGIMQIMPTTAKYTAKKYQLNYHGKNELYEVGKNIEIGSHYLDGLLEQYDNNRIFALAAYNAGPNRVKQWRERTNEKLDAYAFIEAIPFKETRGYVQNILMFETYYRDLMGVDGAFLNEHEMKTKY